MNDNQVRTREAFVRAREHFAQVSSQFSQGGAARQIAADLATVIGDIDTQAAAQAGGIGQARQHTASRDDARRELREDIEAIHRAARAMDLQREFPLPAEGNDRLLLNAARSFGVNATPLKVQFIAHEMPSDFLEDLATDITAFETVIAERENVVGDHVAARAALADLFERGRELLSKLNAMMRNKFANNPDILAEWIRASHVERAPRHKKPVTAQPPPTPPAH